MLGRRHLRSGVRATGGDGFAPGIPACSEGGKLCVVTCGFVCCPLVPDLLIPALCISGAAETDVRSPDRRMSMCSHDHLLGFWRVPTWCRMRSDRPTAL